MDRTCPNCGAPATGRYCPDCGQGDVDLHVPFRQLVAEGLDEAFSVDSRLARTLRPFLTHPGQLTSDYLAGRRARYTSPLKLYLLASFLFFVVAAVQRERGDHLLAVHVGAPGVTVGRAELADLRRSRLGGLLAARLEAAVALPPGEAPRRLSASAGENVPRVVFLLVPVAAALLALLYRASGRYYGEHVVFALHAHAFGFLALLPGLLLGSAAARWTGLAVTAGHVGAALRRVYGGSALATAGRAVLLAIGYTVALGMGLSIVMAISLFTL